MKTSLFHVTKVLDNDCMIRNGAVALGFKVLHRVHVRNIDAPLVRSRTIMTILVYIHREKQRINTVYLLEECNALRPDGEFAWIPLRRVALLHLRLQADLKVSSDELN